MPDPHETDPTNANPRILETMATRQVLQTFGIDGSTVVIDGGCEGDVEFSGRDYMDMSDSVVQLVNPDAPEAPVN